MGISGCSQFPLPLNSRGILQKKGKCTGERNVEDFIHQIAISRKLGLDWQLSLPLKAHFLLGKERPTVTSSPGHCVLLSCSSQLLDQITKLFSLGLHQTLFLPRICALPGLIPGKLLLWPLSSYSYKNKEQLASFCQTSFDRELMR